MKSNPTSSPASPAAPTLTPEAAYEADRIACPLYHDGFARPSWADLSAIAKESWIKNPIPRSFVPAAPCPSASWMPAPVGVAGEVLPAFQVHPAYLPAPVSPSLPAKYMWTKLNVAASEFDHAQVIICDEDGFKVATASVDFAREAVNACNSHATLKADVERLEAALHQIVSMDPYLGKVMQKVASAALSLSEVGRKAGA